MSRSYFHEEDKYPDKPTLHVMDIHIVGDSAVVADGPKAGDVIVRRNSSIRWDYPGLIPEPRAVYVTTYDHYYLVKGVTKPSGVCHGHSLLTLKEMDG